jgi:single-strand DNA-binding protein
MSFNKIIAIGNLGRDPELRYTPQGDAVCDFSIAVNDRKRDKSGEFQDVTTWFKVTLWRKLAENASKYLTKGRSVYVEGRLQVEEWTDRDGKNRYTLIIQGSDIHFINENRGDDMSSGSPSDNEFSNQNESRNNRNTGAAGDVSDSPNDDDIPF